MPSQDLHDRIVELCGLPEVLGPRVVGRALADVGMELPPVGAPKWRRVLSALEKRLRAYMSESEAAERRSAMEAILDEMESSGVRSSDPGFGDVAEPSTPNADA
jgi:hypothetical protein